MKRIILIVFSMLWTMNASAGAVDGKIIKIDIHSDNWETYNVNDKAYMSLYVDGLPKSCNQSSGVRRVIISQDHPLFNAALSIAIAAKQADKRVHINFLNTCAVRSSAWDFGYISMRE
ncbi:hypothetical protein FLL45_08100 [Aliikangiella marina]|uniref:Uncharacterized protein n=1 Tax=Aliikangiella marina TaxID=1712262 RepID=A0A545TCF9_9GAMM|nr:hypothetical protein [Aliikangiella marina]TQV74913.1 hypothetical protein FLL45_08100 [Aliikangiella marina]